MNKLALNLNKYNKSNCIQDLNKLIKCVEFKNYT